MRDTNPYPFGLKPGQMVCSIAGHDRGQYYMVIRAEQGGVWLADGRRRTLDRLKYKNCRHLSVLQENMLDAAISRSPSHILTDAGIRTAVKLCAALENR